MECGVVPFYILAILERIRYERDRSAPQTEVLVTVAGSETGRFVFTPGDYVIGRDPECQIRVDADRVSGTHAKLILNYDHALIEDLGSPNGTQVNGQAVAERTRLWPNQKIQVGTATIRLRRLKVEVSEQSLAPAQAMVKRVLPEEFLREKKYDIGNVVARGGMGAILDAKEATIERTVAMKVMLDGNDPDSLLRFLNEAKITGQLEHPHIVPVHELSVDENGQPYYTMKMVRGITLKKVLEGMAAESDTARPACAEAEAQPGRAVSHSLPALLTIFQKVCDALAFAHSKGVIHRDLKPENIMLGDYGEALVMDWGLAKRMRNGEGGTRNEEAAPDSEDIRTIRHTVAAQMPASHEIEPATLASTMAGTVMGTPQFMSPEQARGEVDTLDTRSDIYSLGAVLFQMLSLRVPVTGKDAMEIVGKVGRGEIEDVAQAFRPVGDRKSQAGKPVPQSLAAVVRKAMALDREARYATVAELQRDITAYQTGFATAAENAGLAKQLVLLVKRHKGMFGTAAAAWLIITALAVWFVVNLRVSERKATRNAEIAEENEQKANMNAQIAQTNEKRAVAGEQEAVAEKENVRRALAKSALALAEAAYREADGPAMQEALDKVPADLRDANWSYLLEQSDTSIARLPFTIRGLAAHPKNAGVFAVVGTKPEIFLINARTGERLLRIPIVFDGMQSRTGFALAFSPDGERIAVGMNNSSGGIAVHNARDGNKLTSWNSKRATRLEFSADGRHLLHVTYGAQLGVWDAADGKLLWEKPTTNRTLRATILPDRTHVLAQSEAGGSVALLALKDGNVARVFENTKSSSGFALRPDGGAFAVGFADGSVRSFGLKDGRSVFSVRAHPGPVKEVIYTPDGERLISVAKLPDGRQSIVALSAATGATVQVFVGGIGDVGGVALHPLSGELLISGDVSRLWEVVEAEPLWVQRMAGETGSPIASAVFLDSDDRFLGPWKNVARTALVDLSTQAIQKLPPNAASQMQTVSADGHLIASAFLGASAGRIQVVKNESGILSKLNEFDFAGGLHVLQLSPKGDRLALVTSGSSRLAAILDPATGTTIVTLDNRGLIVFSHLRWVTGGAQLIGLATANKNRGLAGSEERIIVWDAASGQQLRSVVHPTALDCLAVAPDGKSFAAAGADKLVHVFDTETLAERQAFRAHDGPITALAWHPARPIVATASADLTIKLWNLESGRRLETLRGPTAAPRVLNFSPSGQRLACASEDRMVRIWEPKPLNNAVLDAPATDGWEDLLAKLKADEVKANGNGWTLSGGVLVSPETTQAAVPLGGSYARSSYQVRVTVRKLVPSKVKSTLAMILPVADNQVSFLLDAANDKDKEPMTGLSMVDGKLGHDNPDMLRGQQIKDSDSHDLEITVRLSARTAQIMATLDDRPLYEWSGLPTALQLVAGYRSPVQPLLHLGTSGANWVVSAVKVKRL